MGKVWNAMLLGTHSSPNGTYGISSRETQVTAVGGFTRRQGWIIL
ncbi:hypothetical protein ABZ468_20455 [Streptomyces sp. NPDC005708]